MKGQLITVIVLIFLTDLCDTASQLLLKKHVNQAQANVDSIADAFKLVFHLARQPLVWASLFFSILSLTVWLFVLTKADLNLAFSLDSMRYILIALASMFFLREKVGPLRWLGIVVIIIGISLVAMG